MASWEEFEGLDLRVGTVLNARLNEKARVPAFVLEIDFGELGLKTSSAQLTQHYTPETLTGRQIIAVTGFPPKRIAGVVSEVLVLGGVGEMGTILLNIDKKVPPGTRIA